MMMMMMMMGSNKRMCFVDQVTRMIGLKKQQKIVWKSQDVFSTNHESLAEILDTWIFDVVCWTTTRRTLRTRRGRDQKESHEGNQKGIEREPKGIKRDSKGTQQTSGPDGGTRESKEHRARMV
jgi:hypothetical protein